MCKISFFSVQSALQVSLTTKAIALSFSFHTVEKLSVEMLKYLAAGLQREDLILC